MSTVTLFQISSDVLIASEKSVTDIHTHHFRHFPRFIYPELPLIAPLWASFRSVQLHYRVAQDNQTLQQVVHMISTRNGDLNDYRPKLAVVLTVIDAVLDFDQTQRVSNKERRSRSVVIMRDVATLSHLYGLLHLEVTLISKLVRKT